MSSPPVYRPDPSFREPFNLDTIIRFADRIPFSPPFLVIIPALVALYSQKINDISLIPTDVTSVEQWKAIVTPELLNKFKIPLYMMGLIAFKTVSRALSRITLNNGYYRGDQPDWDQDIAVVTGGANGIGKEVAVLLAERSKKPVVVLDLALMSYAHPNIKYYKTNVADQAEMIAVAAKIRSEVGNPTIVVNNAGIAIAKTILDTPAEGMNRIMAVNTYAHMYSAQAFLPYMIKRNHGHIVTVASAASYMAPPHLSTYTMSKAAALAFHEVLKNETRARYSAPGIRTTICCPTKVDTQLGRNMADHPNKFVTPTLLPETVARRIVGAIDRGLSEHIMLPAYTEIIPSLRGAPAWLRRFIEIIGHTDDSVTDESEKIAEASGYKQISDQKV